MAGGSVIVSVSPTAPIKSLSAGNRAASARGTAYLFLYVRAARYATYTAYWRASSGPAAWELSASTRAASAIDHPRPEAIFCAATIAVFIFSNMRSPRP